MSIKNSLMSLFRNHIGISGVVALVFILTIGITSQSLKQSNAFDIDKLSNFESLYDIDLSNNCVAFECNNQQTVDNSKTISDNTNSNIVSESENTNIENSDGSNQTNGPDPTPTCVQCFENANLTPQQQTELFNLFPGQPNSYDQLCPLIKNSNAADFELVLIEANIMTEDQAKVLVDCLVEAGILVE